MKKNFEFGGGEVILNGEKNVDLLEITCFDELEYECWHLIEQYANLFGFKCRGVDDEEDCIDFYAAKQVQETILKLFEDAGVKFNFGEGEETE